MGTEVKYMAKRQPNIILINADDLGYGDLGCYGSEKNKTPHLDRLAENGLRLTNFYMASPVCSPSRGAMMTGCYPRRIGFGTFEGKLVLFPGQGVGLNPDEITIASLLKSAGYSTAHIGKWHCGDQPAFLPTSHGFDSYYGIPFSNDMGRQKGGRENGPPLPLMADETVIEEQPDQAGITERYTEQAIRFIRENQDGPFFLYMAHMHVHLPHYAPERFIRESENGRFGAALACMDWSVGVLMRELSVLGIANDTLVIFTSDNGARLKEGGSNGALRGAKCTTWDGGLRVPCILHQPGTVPVGVCDGLAASMDFYPTLARLAGAEIPGDRTLDGVDLAPLLAGKPSNRETFFYSLGDSLCAVRHGPWKLHVHLREGWQDSQPLQALYNLDDDIGETVNLYQERPDIVAQLNSLLEGYRAELGDDVTGAPGVNVRSIGRVTNPVLLTEFDPNHPYYMAVYDLPEIG
jgi:arylsulfatase A-like enzyme